MVDWSHLLTPLAPRKKMPLGHWIFQITIVYACKRSKFEIKRNKGSDKTYFLLSENSVYSTLGFW